jgi:deoxyribodipyrimidine photo-lyase
MGLLLRYLLHFGEQQRNFILRRFHLKKNDKKCEKEKLLISKIVLNLKKYYQKKKWFKNFEKLWSPDEESALKELKNFIKDRVTNYSEARNFPNRIGTSKLSPFIKFGQIHVETIWNECRKKKSKTIGTSKFLSRDWLARI